MFVEEPTVTAMPRFTRRHRGMILAISLITVGLVSFVMVWFQPHKLFIDDRVDDRLDGLIVSDAALSTADPSEPDALPPTDERPEADEQPQSKSQPPTPLQSDVTEPTPADDEPTEPVGRDAEAIDAEPVTLSDFQARAAQEDSPHVVSVSEFVRLDKETTGNALLVAMPDGSFLVRFEGFRTGNGPDVYIELSRGGPLDGQYGDMLRLGRMRGNVGDQNYEVPAGVDLGEYQSIVIWCERFRSPFGSAPLIVPS